MLNGISKRDLKRINRMQVLRTIWEAGPISRVDLSQQLQITRASITQITNAMIAEGLLMEIGEAPYQNQQDSKLPKGRISMRIINLYWVQSSVSRKSPSDFAPCIWKFWIKQVCPVMNGQAGKK